MSLLARRFAIGVFCIGILLFPACLSAVIHTSESELRTFTSTDGRTLEARLDHYDPNTGSVTIRTQDGRKYELPISRFSESDRAYCVEWRADYDASFVRVDFFTNRIEGGRIVFMLDRSGSMNGDRWEKLVRNMSDIIDRLDDGTEFNIILFSSGADRFHDDLAVADDRVRTEAISWLNRQRPFGGTDMLDAIRAATSISKARVYAILSDGMPSNPPEQIRQAILQNQAENDTMIKVYTVGYYAPQNCEDFLKGLSDEFNGGFVRR